MTIDKFDYLEPTCPLCGGEEFYYPEKKKKTGNIPVENIIAKLDACLDKEDYEGGERLVNFWIAEAQSLGDTRGELSMQSELMGHFRKMGQAKKALQSVEAGLKILFAEKLENTISGATILVNAATTMKAFGRAKEALPYYEKAREVYEKDLEFGDFRLASLYNNYGLACGELEEKEKATELYNLAIKGLEKTGNNQLEIAISLLNLADLQNCELETEAEIAKNYVKEAFRLIDLEEIPRDGYYAFVCRKCSGVFAFYNREDLALELKRRADEIYARP